MSCSPAACETRHFWAGLTEASYNKNPAAGFGNAVVFSIHHSHRTSPPLHLRRTASIFLVARMKLERLHEYILITVVILAGSVFALYAGSKVGAGDSAKVGAVIFAFAVALLLIRYKMRAWVWIPLFWPIASKVGFLPGELPVRDLVIIVLFGAFLVFKALKISKIKPVYEWVDLVLVFNILYLLSVFIRNPVGTESMGSEKVGGRGYFEVIFALLAYWVIQRVRIDDRTATRLPIIMVAGTLFTTVLQFMADHFPFSAQLIGKVLPEYAATDTQGSLNTQPDAELERQQYLAGAGSAIFQLLCARYLPTTLFNPLYIGRFLLAVMSVQFIFLSGHRIGIFYIGFVFFMALYFRKGIATVIMGLALVIPLLALLITLQSTVLPLPFAAQRALCFLPGKWDQAAVADAKNSSEWRYEMWRIALTTDKYIVNKWLGDGFGFTRRQLEEMVSASTESQENFMIVGDFHSGPVSAIRYVGYVGLVLFVILLASIARCAWKLIIASRDTPFYCLALFIGLPAIYHLGGFLFVMGGYQNDLPQAIFNTAMLQMTSFSLARFKESARGAGRKTMAASLSFSRRPSLPRMELPTVR